MPQLIKNRYFLFILVGIVGAGMLVALLSPWKALAIAVLVVALFVVFSRPEWMVMFLALYIPLEPFLLKFVPDEIYIYARYGSEVLVYLLLASAAVSIFLRKKRFAFTPIDPWFLGFLFVAGIALLANQVPVSIGVLGVRQLIRFILLFYAVVYVAPSKVFMQKLAGAALVLVFLESLLGITQAVIGAPMDSLLIPSERKFYESIQLTTGTTQTWEAGRRVFATLGRYDQLGTFLSFFLLLTIGWLWSVKQSRNKWVFWMVLAAGIPALILTYSRASWFGFALGFLAMGLFLKKDRRIAYGLMAVTFLLGAYLFVSGIVVKNLIDTPTQNLVERFFESFSYERWRGEYYGLGRLYFIVQTLATVVPHSPIFGVGPGQYGGGAAAALHNTRVYDELGLPFGVYGTEGYIDNNWLSLMGETGILGFLLYAGMLVVLGRSAWRLYHKTEDVFVKGMALGYFGCLFAVTLQAFLAQHLEARTLALYVWMFGAFVVILEEKERVKG